MILQTVFNLIALLTIIAALPSPSPPLLSAKVPSQDEFYKPDSGFENQPLGTVLKYRQVVDGYGFIVFRTNIQAAYQFLVRSEDSFGNATAIVTTLLVPHNADPTKILSYQPAEDSADSDCANSYAIQLSSSPLSWLTPQLESLLFNSGLYEGWYVVVPDHLGPKSSFGAGLQAAHALLNSLRGVLSSGSLTGIHSDARIALWGYSGGSQPTTWGAALAPKYAPELNIVGAATGGIVANWRDVISADSNSLFGFFVAQEFSGFANEYTELWQFYQDNIYPSQLPRLIAATKNCLVVEAILNLFTSFDELSPKGSAILQEEPLNTILNGNNLNNLNATPSIPFYFYSATIDEVVPVAGTQVLYDRWCAAGVSIQWRQDLLSEHVTQGVVGTGDAFVWIRDILNGKTQSGCQKINSLSNVLNADAVLGLATLILDIAKLILNVPTGPIGIEQALGLPTTFTPSDVVQQGSNYSIPSISKILNLVNQALQKQLPADADQTSFQAPISLTDTTYTNSILELTEYVKNFAQALAVPGY